MDTELWNRTWTGIQNTSFSQTIELVFGKDNLTFTQGYVCILQGWLNNPLEQL
jgi:hypothetical protein